MKFERCKAISVDLLGGGLFDNTDQHDCQEFLKLLIYAIHDENNVIAKHSTPKIVYLKNNLQNLIQQVE
jgi:ubiquitin C-terminal hydrolase